MTFQKEADFEEALIKVLADKGWEKEVIKNPTEQDLIRNWAKILFDNNRGIDRLNNYSSHFYFLRYFQICWNRFHFIVKTMIQMATPKTVRRSPRPFDIE